jgi:hypothetical protein
MNITLLHKFTLGKPPPTQQVLVLADGTAVLAQPQSRSGKPMRNVGNSRKLRRAADRQARS